ncbi:AraC family transcriptional regulator, partial [Pseudomonas corrugata]
MSVIDARTSGPGDFDTPISGLTFFRREAPAASVLCMVEPSVVLVARGAKQLWVGGDSYTYDPSRFLLTSLDLPANSEVVIASAESPCIGLTLKLDLRVVAELIAQGSLPPHRSRPVGASVGIGQTTADILRPFNRLLSLLDEPEAIPALAPLIQREIHYRLLV